MALGCEVEPVLVDLVSLEHIAKAERARLASPRVNLRSFWRDYLLGRQLGLGFELMASTTAYRQLMMLQIERLELADNHTVVDLGCGTGEFPLLVARTHGSPTGLRLIEVDYVAEALVRGRQRLDRASRGSGIASAFWVAADVEAGRERSLPIARGSADAVLASLLLSYVSHPEDLLGQIHDVLRPGGRLVVSTMRRDADISKIYVDGIAELPPDRVREHFGMEAGRRFSELQRQFLNHAARLMTLEEEGVFRFWDSAELAAAVSKVGFTNVVAAPAFGEPPQAVVVSAVRA
jgi:ubiquinone/menaquinone biosynthesis C-methylase UbiE